MTDCPLTIAYQGVLAAIRLTIATLNRVLNYDDSKPSNPQILLHRNAGVYVVFLPDSGRASALYDDLASFRAGELDDAVQALSTLIGALTLAQWLSTRTTSTTEGPRHD